MAATPRPEFVKDPHFRQQYNPNPPLRLVGTSAKAYSELRIAVEYEGSLTSRHRMLLGSIPNVINGTPIEFSFISVNGMSQFGIHLP